MTMDMTENIIKWLDRDAPAWEPPKLRDDAPQEAKKEFDEWQQRKAEDKANGIWR